MTATQIKDLIDRVEAQTGTTAMEHNDYRRSAFQLCGELKARLAIGNPIRAARQQRQTWPKFDVVGPPPWLVKQMKEKKV